MIKRVFDVLFSIVFLILFCWVLLISWIIAIIDTRSNGIFIQDRIGQHGKHFKIFKLRTIKIDVQTKQKGISKCGKMLRKYKLDELPQLLNVVKGNMSIVGPRPDIPGYYDLLTGEHRKILELKPGLTSLASLKYSREEEILDRYENHQMCNDLIIFPDKVTMNLDYYYNRTFFVDIKVVVQTIGSVFFKLSGELSNADEC